MQAVRNNKSNSGYSNLILNTGHKTDTVDIIKTEKKGKHLNSLAKYHIYKIGINKKQTTHE
jgi:hypothetical protein